MSGDAGATQVTFEFLDAFADAWNRHDVDAMMSAMTEDCVFEASALEQRFAMHRKLREETLGQDLPAGDGIPHRSSALKAVRHGLAVEHDALKRERTDGGCDGDELG